VERREKTSSIFVLNAQAVNGRMGLPPDEQAAAEHEVRRADQANVIKTLESTKSTTVRIAAAVPPL